ncbi:alpha/beta fold hydrolase [Dongia sp. agr-C8]
MRVSKEKIGRTALYATRHHREKRNLLILHGALGSSERIFFAGVPFEDDFNVLFCDLRGHGSSDVPPDGYEPANLAADLVEPIKATFGTAPFGVLAESFSGIVALELGRLLPQLQCIAMIDTPFDNQRMTKSIDVIAQSYQDYPKSRPVLAAFGAEFFGWDISSRTVTPKRYFSHLEGIGVPILMITGSQKAVEGNEEGAYFTEQDRSTISSVYKGTFTVYEVRGGGHQLLKTHVVATIEAARSFFERNCPAGIP